jgi:hypothetical protein
MLIVLQHNVAHLGIVTGLCLSEAATQYCPKWISRPILGSAVLASISTSLAEILGGAIALQSKEKKEFNRKKRERKAARARYRKSHPKKRGEKRGRPRKRANEKYVPAELSNGDTKVELFTRVKRVLPQSGEKWSESQKNRANMVFEFAPKLKEAYSLVCKLRAVFRNKKLTKETARTKLHEWYKEVSASRIAEMISAMKTLKSKEDEVLNYFVNRATNAAAESLNSKMKGFRSELRGVRDLPFYLFRCCRIFG